MSKLDPASTSLRTAISLALTGVGLMLPAHMALAQDATDQDSSALEEVVVTGFRGSLNTALGQKREATAAIDTIVAEDIGKFPDSNLAESMQRIPGVTLSRTDGGEGRNISVRGLGPTFTRVRVNGMEGASQTGSSDIYGAGNNGRSFDFNIFPTEIFSNLTVRKTSSADIEEGSLGATVDLRAPRPFDFVDENVFTFTGRGVTNTVSEDVDPRLSLLASKKFFNDTFGVLASVAYQERFIREVGYSAVNILPASDNANNLGTATAPIFLPYCTPIGWTTTGQSPANNAARGTTATACNTGNARTSNLAAYNTVYNMIDPDRRDAAGNLIPGSGAFLPRLPRYVNSEQDTERTGGTITLQWMPNDNTSLALDGLISKYQQERRDNYILGLSLGRLANNGGQPYVSIRDITFDDKGSVETATFDGMDVRSEGLVDQFTSTFQQLNLDFEHRFSERFKVTGTAGRSINDWDGPLRLQTFIDRLDVPNFTLDFRGRETPLIGFGFDVSDPNQYRYAASADAFTVLGGYSFQRKPSRNVTTNTVFELNGDFQANDVWAVKGGLQWREANFKLKNSLHLNPSMVATQNLPAGVTMADLTTQITGLDKKFGSGAPASWAAVDSRAWRDIFNFPDFVTFCNIECGADRNQLLEEVSSAYGMLSFDSGDAWSIPVRGELGVRYAYTRQSAVGYVPIAQPMGSIPANVGSRRDVDQDYDDFLPSMNVVFELTPDLQARLSAAKVLSRAPLGSLTPSTTATATTQTATVNNPFLDPIRATTADLGLEWYFRPGSMLSVAYFYKDIETFIQRIVSNEPWSSLGLPDSLLINTPSTPSSIFAVTRWENTKGGPLNGFEVNAQIPFDWLEGVWGDFGILANYTFVESEIEYVLNSANGVPTVTTTDDLVDLSPNSASGTLFYDNGTFSIRATGSYRDEYIRQIPAGAAGSDIQGNKANTFVDAAASWNVNDNLSLIFEAQNLTEERNTLYIDSDRQDTLFQTEIGRTFTLGATYKF